LGKVQLPKDARGLRIDREKWIDVSGIHLTRRTIQLPLVLTKNGKAMMRTAHMQHTNEARLTGWGKQLRTGGFPRKAQFSQ
jgi:hypothetical protein